MKKSNILILFGFIALISSCKTEITRKEGNPWHERFSSSDVFNKWGRENEGKVIIKNKIMRYSQ
jgi:hypothetical protein